MIGKEKQISQVCLLGDTDSGKDTLIYQLQYQCSEKKKRDQTIETFQDYVSNGRYLKRRCSRQIEDDLSDTLIETPQAKFNLVNNRGHHSMIKSLISNVCRTDFSIVMIDSDPLCFERDTPYEMAREHIWISYARGIFPLIICINKIDLESVSYKFDLTERIKQKILAYAKDIGYKEDQLIFIPISAKIGDNIFEKSLKTPWYEGGTLIDILHALQRPNQARSDASLRAAIHKKYKIAGIGTVITCKIISGSLKANPEICFASNNTKSIAIKSIETSKVDIQDAFQGMYVGINLKGVPIQEVLKGDVIGTVKNNPPKIAKKIIVKFRVLNHPTKIKAGYQPLFHFCHSNIPCKIVKIISKVELNPSEKKENADDLQNGEEGLVEVALLKQQSVEKFKDYPALGTFIVTDHKRVVAIGKIEDFE